jgi:hypothetical protein
MTVASNKSGAADHSERGTLLRHPLTITIATLLIGSVLTSFIVPWLTYSRTLKEKRLEKALELLAYNAEVNQRLNTLVTTLEIFHKDNSGVAARFVNYKEEQRTLRRVMMERYLEFDSVAWWRLGRVSAEADILRLTSPEEAKRIAELTEAYGSNLKKSTETLNQLWDRFLREEYRPDDKANDAAMAETRRRLRTLRDSRDKFISDIAREFAGK